VETSGFGVAMLTPGVPTAGVNQRTSRSFVIVLVQPNAVGRSTHRSGGSISLYCKSVTLFPSFLRTRPMVRDLRRSMPYLQICVVTLKRAQTVSGPLQSPTRSLEVSKRTRARTKHWLSLNPYRKTSFVSKKNSFRNAPIPLSRRLSRFQRGCTGRTGSENLGCVQGGWCSDG